MYPLHACTARVPLVVSSSSRPRLARKGALGARPSSAAPRAANYQRVTYTGHSHQDIVIGICAPNKLHCCGSGCENAVIGASRSYQMQAAATGPLQSRRRYQGRFSRVAREDRPTSL
eukprot:2681417-Pyramimonas_sp.AAC.1